MLLIISSFAFFSFLQKSEQAPLPRSATDAQVVSWQSEPTLRGTWSILRTCVITLTVCVYTAIHLNVPHKDTTKSRGYLRRAKWVLMGIFAPELVVYTAWMQWASARALTRAVERLDLKISSENSPAEKWTLSHSFFVQMGGLAIDISYAETKISHSRHESVTLTPQGFLQICKLGIEIPQLTGKSINDRSKADGLAKILACLQSAYMIFQVVGRLANRLPVTLLEINTLGHVICALAMYAFWLSKPLDVHEPVLLTGENIHNLGVVSAAAMNSMRFLKLVDEDKEYVESYESENSILTASCELVGENNYEMGDIDCVAGDPLKNISAQSCLVPPNEPIQSPLNPPPCKTKKAMKVKRVPEILARAPTKEELQAWPRSFVLLTWPGCDPNLANVEAKDWVMASPFWNGRITHIYLSTTPIRCLELEQTISKINKPYLWTNINRPWNRLLSWHILPLCVFHHDLVTYEAAWEALTELKNTFQPLTSSSTLKENFFIGVQARSEDFLWGIQEVPSDRDNYHQIDYDIVAAAAIAFAAGCYGGFHAAAWCAFFPTATERLLWRISALTIAGSGVVGATIILIDSDLEIIYFLNDLKGWMGKKLERLLHMLGLRTSDSLIRSLSNCIVVAIPAAAFVFYFFCRAFIVIEAFISLRSIPEKAYQTPSWSQWLPHL